MKNNQRGGILSTIILVPIAVALMAGFFFLGYFVGRHQSKSGTMADAMPPLPEMISKNLPKDEFTFYKSLTDKSDRTVSLDLKPKPASEEKSGKAPVDETARAKGAQQSRSDKKTENKALPGKKTGPAQSAQKQQVSSKKEPLAAQKPGPTQRYTLQIAAYPGKDMAEADVRKMKQRGYAAFVVASELPGKGTWYRVRLGSFSSKTSAEKLQKELRAKEGMSSIISIE